MTRTELLAAAKPILFHMEAVRAILDGQQRRKAKEET